MNTSSVKQLRLFPKKFHSTSGYDKLKAKSLEKIVKMSF